jgi:AraC-like DNA-binding protein
MRPIVEIIARKVDQSFSCKEKNQDTFDIGWHVHHELQMSLFISGRGYRIVGDSIAALHPGDLVLVGADVPHIWHHEDLGQHGRQKIHFITINFREDFLGEAFLKLPEMVPVRSLFARAKRGLRIKGVTRDRVAAKMHAISSGAGLRRLVDLLDILEVLANSSETEPIATAGFSPEMNLSDEKRLSQICGYIIEHLEEPVDRDELARLVNLTPTSFSRYFRMRTGRTLPNFINELRVGRACRMLSEKDTSVTEIALACGFPNLAHFHRQFRQRIKLTPREYRHLVHRLTDGGA